MPAKMDFELQFRPGTRRAPQRDEGTPFRMLICADLSGRSARGICEGGESLAKRRLMSIDVDNIDQTMRRIGARLPIPSDDASTAAGEIAIDSVDDFHPDGLCAKVAGLDVLCQLRRRLVNPATAAATMQALTREVPGAAAAGTPQTSSPEASSSMLDRLLGARPGASAGQRQNVVAGVDEILRQAVTGHVVPAVDSRQHAAFIASVDHALTESMQRLLHAPAFQQLEAAWRSVHWLVSNIGPDEDLQIVMLDVSKAELSSDLLAARTLEESAIYRRIAGSPPWSLLVGDFACGPDQDDAALITALGALGEAAGGPFLAAADDRLVGCRVPDGCSSPASWASVDRDATAPFRTVRRSAAASFVGLTWPHWLIRVPYGVRREPVESFAFEEIAGPPGHTSFLWGSGAFLAAAVIASALREDPTEMPQGPIEVGDLPLYAYEDDGESRMQPCGECWLTEQGINESLGRGFMPLVSVRGHNAIRLVRLQSIADPAAPLARLAD